MKPVRKRLFRSHDYRGSVQHREHEGPDQSYLSRLLSPKLKVFKVGSRDFAPTTNFLWDEDVNGIRFMKLYIPKWRVPEPPAISVRAIDVSRIDINEQLSPVQVRALL